LVLRHLVKRAGHDVVAEAWPGDPATLARILRLARIPSPEPQPEPASNPAPEPGRSRL
jgi:hypothetical protein